MLDFRAKFEDKLLYFIIVYLSFFINRINRCVKHLRLFMLSKNLVCSLIFAHVFSKLPEFIAHIAQ